MSDSANEALWERAKAVMPGGVNSPVRDFNGVNRQLENSDKPICPLTIVSGNGSHITDADGNTYVDYSCGFGSMILGHAHPEAAEAISRAALNGSCFGMNTPGEVELAELVTSAYPAVEKIRLVSSETEAAMSAVRLARGFTKRTDIVKFAGCYHGHPDELLVAGGAGFLTSGIPDSAGVLPQSVARTHVLQYNNIEAIHYLFSHLGTKIACVIVEPIAVNMGLVIPVDGFLQQLRSVSEKYGTLLVFDETTTGFRHTFGGVQGKTKLRPDLTIFGKILGGGLPLAAYGGRADIMNCVSPSGPVQQTGNFSGNPVSIAAGLATLTVLQKSPEIYTHVFSQAISLQAGLLSAAQKKGLAIQVPLSGSMLSLFFSKNTVKNETDAQHSDLHMFAKFYGLLLKRGIYLAPSPYETMYVSAALSSEDVSRTYDAISDAFMSL
ncbi:MAG: glutamate-1-semialdehyde 2,1-aminomutase [Eubacteriales bacterium]